MGSGPDTSAASVLATQTFPTVSQKLLVSMGVSKAAAATFEGPLNEAMRVYEINTSARQAMFLANVMEESNHLGSLVESGNYRIKNLNATWNGRFDTEAEIKAVLKNEADLANVDKLGVVDQEKLFNTVYGGRLGNDSPGDGFKYRGRGLLQVTGKAGYKARGDALGVDLVGKPELLADPKWASLSAADYWYAMKLNAVADANNEAALVQTAAGVNRGDITKTTSINGLAERKSNWKKILPILQERDRASAATGKSLGFVESSPLGIREHPQSTPMMLRRTWCEDALLPSFMRNMFIARAPRYF